MAIAFTLVRTVDVSGGFSADANPNSTNPAAAAVFPATNRVQGQSEDQATRSVMVYVRAVTASTGAEVPAATVTYTVWAQDAGATSSPSAQKVGKTRWVACPSGSHATVPSSQAVEEKLLGDIFVQLTAASLGAATSLEVWVADSAAN